MVSDQEEVNDMYRIMLVEDDATIVDILSLLVYFQIATLLLGL